MNLIYAFYQHLFHSHLFLWTEIINLQNVDYLYTVILKTILFVIILLKTSELEYKIERCNPYQTEYTESMRLGSIERKLNTLYSGLIHTHKQTEELCNLIHVVPNSLPHIANYHYH